MDNEEIRELLKELKETSDESSSVKSKVVKIHFDTRKEAEAREKARQKAKEEEERQRLLKEEEEKKRQEELAREAEEKAQEIVEKAKAQASSVFSPDLGSDMDKLEEDAPADEEPSEDDDLDLNWNPASMAGAGIYSAGSGDGHQDRESEEKESGEDPEEPDEDEQPESLKDRLLGKVKSGVSGFMLKLARQDEEREAEESGRDEEAPEDTDESLSDADLPDDDLLDVEVPGDTFSGPSASAHASGGFSSDAGPKMREIKVPQPEEEEAGKETGRDELKDWKKQPEDWKKRMEEPPRFNLRHVKIPEKPVIKWNRKKAEADAPAETDTVTKTEGPAEEAAAELAAASAEKKAEETAAASASAQQTAEITAAATSGAAAAAETGKPDLSKDDFESDAADFRTPGSEKDFPSAAGKQEGKKTEKPERKLSDFLNLAKRPRKHLTPEDRRAQQEEEQESLQKELAQMRQDFGKQERKEAESASEEAKVSSAPQSIEVVNLNENANHKQVEVIRLDKEKTGPLPDLAGKTGGRKRAGSAGDSLKTLKGAGSALGGFLKKLVSSAKSGPEESQPSVSEILQQEDTEAGRQERESGPAAGKKKKLITYGLILAGIVLIVLLIIWAMGTGIGGSSSSTGSGVTADEGLNVRIKQQPMEYVKEGDVTLTIRVPNTIQSITADDQAVKFEGDKKTEITVHATGSKIKLMVVSTDKVRSATVKLSYIDSEAPVVSAGTNGNMVTLSAKDDASGVAGIYYGTTGPLSDVPLYQAYKEPFAEEEGVVYSWYAVDRAGNMSVPKAGRFTEAKSMTFEKESYTVYPNSNVTLGVSVEPEGGFLNNLTYQSSDESVVKIEHGNVLVPVEEGEATVTASADGLDPATAKVVVSNAKTVTISVAGDCTLGTDPKLAPDNSFVAYQNVYGNHYFMQNVKSILSEDDATFANFEGTLTTSDQAANKKFTFKGDASCTEILEDGSINVVTLANNHTEDYGDQGLADTEENLEEAGIDWCSGDQIAYEDLNGVKTAFIGIYAVENGLDSLDQVKSTVAEAEDEGAQLIIVYFHWNSELVPDPNQDMVTLGHAAVDAGADLVVGSHSHLVSGIEKYEGRYIVYGLGNFCFGGNLYPSDYDSMIFRQTFTVGGDGVKDDDQIEIIPVRISSMEGANNYQPTPVSGDAAAQIMQKIDERSAQFGSTWDDYMVDGTEQGTGDSAA